MSGREIIGYIINIALSAATALIILKITGQY